MESRSVPASPIVPSFLWIGAILRKLIRVSNSNTINKSEVTTQEMSQTVEENHSKLFNTVEDTTNESSNVIEKSNFKTTVNMDQTMHDLKSIAQRPLLIYSGDISSTTSTNGDAVFSYNLATFNSMTATKVPGLIRSFVLPQVLNDGPIRNKIADFNFLKADIKFMVKVNCPPNVSGALLAVYIPITYGNSLDFSNLTLQALTSYPCKILDYSTDTSLEMTVPYINQYDYTNASLLRNNGQTDTDLPVYGAVALFNLQSPLSATSADFVSCSVFANFENIELALPVQTPVATGTGPFIAQSGETVQRIPGKNIMTGGNSENNVKLSYTTEVQDYSKVTFDKDESSLKYILSRENIIGKLSYGAGKDIFTDSYLGKVRCFPKRPNAKYSGSKPIQMGTFDYVSNLFARYTGTIKIGIRLIKTKFHYGRIAVVFDPFNNLSDSTVENPVQTLLTSNYNMIIDLNANDGKEGGSNYYSINVPYINNAGFSTIGKFSSTGFKGTESKLQQYNAPTLVQSGQECYNPYLRFYALTKLGHLSTAANTVPIFVSISAGDDYELSIPTVRVCNSNPADNTQEDPFYCQSSLDIIHYSKETSNSNIKTCNGEKITNVNQIANRFTKPKVFYNYNLFPYMDYNENSDLAGTPDDTLTTIPIGSVLSLSMNTPLGHKLSNYEAIANIFRYAYGGRRYKVYCSSRNDVKLMSRLLHVPNFKGLEPVVIEGVTKGYAYKVAPASTSATAISGQMHVASSINNILEIERPFYSNRKLIANRLPTAISRYNKIDEVVLQVVALVDGGTVQTRTLPVAAKRTTIGPSCLAKQDYLTISPNDVNDVQMDLGDIIQMEERTLDVSNESEIRQKTCPHLTVLEALGTGAGFTFLQAPPCVIFG